MGELQPHLPLFYTTIQLSFQVSKYKRCPRCDLFKLEAGAEHLESTLDAFNYCFDYSNKSVASVFHLLLLIISTQSSVLLFKVYAFVKYCSRAEVKDQLWARSAKTGENQADCIHHGNWSGLKQAKSGC